MSESLIDTLVSAVDSGDVAATAAELGVPGPVAARGLRMGVWAIGAGLVSKLGDIEFVRHVFDLVSAPPATTATASDAPAFLSSIFGGRLSAVASTIARTTGLSAESGVILLGAASPIVLGALASHVRTNGLSPTGFTDWLIGQKDSLLRGGPSMLRDALGIRDAAPSLPPALPEPRGVPLGPGSSVRRLVPLVALVLVVGLVWSVVRRSGGNVKAVADTVAGDVAGAKAAETSTATAIVASADTVAAVAVESAGTLFVDRRLPSGATLRVPHDGTEAKLLTYLDTNAAPGSVPDTVWFEFDRLQFDKDAATLTPTAELQLSDVAAILAAYPTVHTTIGGYTDNTGDPAHNLSLSQARATSVVMELIAMGIHADRLTATGYGDAHPIADNSTEAGRSRNRRIAIRVTER